MADDHRPDPRAFIENLMGQLPVHRKFLLFIKNNARKLLTAKNCCGHPGEPGC